MLKKIKEYFQDKNNPLNKPYIKFHGLAMWMDVNEFFKHPDSEATKKEMMLMHENFQKQKENK